MTSKADCNGVCGDATSRRCFFAGLTALLVAFLGNGCDRKVGLAAPSCSDYDTASLVREDFLTPQEPIKDGTVLAKAMPEEIAAVARDRKGVANQNDAPSLVFAYSEIGDRRGLLRWCPVWLKGVADRAIVSGNGAASGYEACKDAFLHAGKPEEALVYLDSLDQLLARDPKAQGSLPEGFPFMRFWDRAEIYEFQGRRREVLDLLLPHAATWGGWGGKRPLLRAIRHLHSQPQILLELESAEAKLEVGNLQDAPPIIRHRVDSLARGSESFPAWVGWTEMFGRPIHLVLRTLDSSRDLRAQHLDLFRESEFYQGLRCDPSPGLLSGKE